jgi:hypothetical protein
MLLLSLLSLISIWRLLLLLLLFISTLSDRMLHLEGWLLGRCGVDDLRVNTDFTVIIVIFVFLIPEL